MKVENRVRPNKEQIEGFFEGEDNSAIHMINLLKFKDKAVYEDGRKTSLTGKEAYMIYSNEVKKHLKKVGGKAIFLGEVTRLMLGDVEELWDTVGIAMYPSKNAMMTMITDPDYIESEKHRSAGLKGQLNIETIGKTL
jgi:uncharacterized protein (DUF1330 family)|tara:strand:+ start:1828 stop:2241 length:414 start_codon:yes stop_codon:yes gene_type:complete